jgi:phage terminase Nu1 subunit (DNA packaging protein)
VSDKLQQKGIAEILGVVPRQVHNLVNEGMPSHLEKGKRYFLAAECVPWYVEYKIRSAAPKSNKNADRLDELELRKEEVAVRSAELKLAREEGRLISIEYLEHQVSTILEGLRGKLLSFAGKNSPELVGMKSPAEARAKLDAAIEEVMQALVDVGTDPSLDDVDGDDKLVDEYQEPQAHGGSLKRRKLDRDD